MLQHGRGPASWPAVLLALLVALLALGLSGAEASCAYPPTAPGDPVWSNLATCPERFHCQAFVGQHCEFECESGYEPRVAQLTCTNPDEWNNGDDLTDNCRRTERGPNVAFGVAFLILTFPLGLGASILFYRRRHIQPLKARQPVLVVVASAMFLLWVVLLCVQRIVNDHYPCWLQLWTGYLGVLVLANVYMVRCFILYANFVQTSKMVEIQKEIEEKAREKGHIRGSSRFWGSSGSIAKTPNSKRAPLPATMRQAEAKRDEASDESSDEEPNDHPEDGGEDDELAKRLKASSADLLDDGSSNARGANDAALTIKRYRKFMKQSILSYFSILASVILLLPAIIVTALYEDVRCWVGDGCLLHWHGAATALALYCAVYLLIFLFIALKIRGKIDAFGIKTELKFVGLGGILCLIPWFVFNNFKDLQTINDEVFPFSTLFNILGVMNALLMGTAYPLWLSYHRPPAIEKPVNSKIDTLQELLEDPRGFESFKRFLTTEFSVENALFWKDVENYRAYVRRVQEMPDEQKLDEISRLAWASRRIYQDYVQTDGALEVNLPSDIVQELDDAYKDIKADMDRLAKLTKSGKCYALANLVLAKFGGPHPGQDPQELERAVADADIGGGGGGGGGKALVAPEDDDLGDDSDLSPPPMSDDEDEPIPMGRVKKGKKKAKRRKGRKRRGGDLESPEAADSGRNRRVAGGLRVPARGMFDPAQENIFQLMQRDSEPRYRRSEIYDALITTIRNEQEDHQNRAMLDMT